jgi:hypothetical protein
MEKEVYIQSLNNLQKTIDDLRKEVKELKHKNEFTSDGSLVSQDELFNILEELSDLRARVENEDRETLTRNYQNLTAVHTALVHSYNSEVESSKLLMKQLEDNTARMKKVLDAYQDSNMVTQF